MIMSNKQILDYFETDLEDFAKRGVKPMTCVQVAGTICISYNSCMCELIAGDVLVVPESWGHGVLNLQVSHNFRTRYRR